MIMMRAVMSAVVGLALFAPVAAAAAGTAYCVSCEGPAAHYACSFDGAAVDANDASLKLLCITELAKSGKHASCSVDRKQPSPCPGDLKVMALPDGHPSAVQPATAAPANPSKPTAEPTQAAPLPKPVNETAVEKTEAPPKTVQEMVEKGTSNTGKVLEKTGETAADAAKTTGSAVEKAGKAVGDAAKKTWTCITSLFGNC
jgi:type IV secretory pathway VirB10-like protein